MKRISVVLLISLLPLSFSNCRNNEKPLDAPEITLTGISHDQVISGDVQDTLFIGLRYRMKVRNVANDTAVARVILRDSRDQTNQRFSYPDELKVDISDEIDAGKTNISGTITLRLTVGNFLVLRPTRPNGDTMRYEIFLEDIEGNTSNIIETQDIYILP